jgi:hypothetical protein
MLKYTGAMDETRQFTTGQVSGICILSHMALYRYVKAFGEFFSEGVRDKHTRGRRWSLADIETIKSIQALFHDRTGPDGIRTLLRSGWRLGSSAAYSREALAGLAEVVQVFEAEAKAARHEAREVIEQTKFNLKRMLEDNEKLRADVLALRQEVFALKHQKHRGLFG